MLLIGSDMNAKIEGRYSLHDANNRNGQLLTDFLHQFNLIAGNTVFQKPLSKLWTHRYPNGFLSQIDFVLYRKRWQYSVHDCQAFSSSNPIGSDHRIVTAKVKLSVRRPSPSTSKKLFWQSLTYDKTLSKRIDNEIVSQFTHLPNTHQNYTTFVSIANKVGSNLLPKRERKPPSNSIDAPDVVAARKATLRSSKSNIRIAQSNLRNTYDRVEDTRINNILHSFETSSSSAIKNAWDLVKKLSGKKSRSVVFIEGTDRLKSWENHFKNLLNADSLDLDNPPPIMKVFDESLEIPSGIITKDELDSAIDQLKNGKAPGLDGLPPEFWKMKNIRHILLKFCIETFLGDRPDEWGISTLIPIPKKGDLTKPDNYRGIALSQIASKVYNRIILNRIRPVVDKLLRPNQNGFREGRSTSAHVLALRRIVEELKNHKKEAVISFIDFRKAFDSINRDRMFQILQAYGIPETVVNAIKVMYRDTSATVTTPEGQTDPFVIGTGVLQGDPLAPFLFIIVLDYALRSSITNNHGLTLKHRRSRRHPPERLADLDYADDIALLENHVQAAQTLLCTVELACQNVGLFLNAKKTKFIHINRTNDDKLYSSDGSEIERVDDFLYLGSYTETDHDMNVRIAQAWNALHSLRKIWKSNISKPTKTKVFKACVESILLYGSESWTLNIARTKRLDGTYTRMLRSAFDISWKNHPTIPEIYDKLSCISNVVCRRRLALAGHVSRHDEPTGKFLFWIPEENRRIGRPNITLRQIIEDDTGLNGDDLATAMSLRS